MLSYKDLKTFQTSVESSKRNINDSSNEINKILNEIKEYDLIKVIYYNKNCYSSKKGVITKINYLRRFLYIDSTRINFKDIYKIHLINS